MLCNNIEQNKVGLSVLDREKEKFLWSRHTTDGQRLSQHIWPYDDGELYCKFFTCPVHWHESSHETIDTYPDCHCCLNMNIGCNFLLVKKTIRLKQYITCTISGLIVFMVFSSIVLDCKINREQRWTIKTSSHRHW